MFYYWSSTSNMNYPNFAWYVSLDNGRLSYSGKTLIYYVWPVRGGQ